MQLWNNGIVATSSILIPCPRKSHRKPSTFKAGKEQKWVSLLRSIKAVIRVNAKCLSCSEPKAADFSLQLVRKRTWESKFKIIPVLHDTALSNKSLRVTWDCFFFMSMMKISHYPTVLDCVLDCSFSLLNLHQIFILTIWVSCEYRWSYFPPILQ